MPLFMDLHNIDGGCRRATTPVPASDDARARANRPAGPYVWFDGYILDAQLGVQCEPGRRHGHPDTGLDRGVAGPGIKDRDERAHPPIAAPRCGPCNEGGAVAAILAAEVESSR